MLHLHPHAMNDSGLHCNIVRNEILEYQTNIFTTNEHVEKLESFSLRHYFYVYRQMCL